MPPKKRTRLTRSASVPVTGNNFSRLNEYWLDPAFSEQTRTDIRNQIYEIANATSDSRLTQKIMKYLSRIRFGNANVSEQEASAAMEPDEDLIRFLSVDEGLDSLKNATEADIQMLTALFKFCALQMGIDYLPDNNTDDKLYLLVAKQSGLEIVTLDQLQVIGEDFTATKSSTLHLARLHAMYQAGQQYGRSVIQISCAERDNIWREIFETIGIQYNDVYRETADQLTTMNQQLPHTKLFLCRVLYLYLILKCPDAMIKAKALEIHDKSIQHLYNTLVNITENIPTEELLNLLKIVYKEFKNVASRVSKIDYLEILDRKSKRINRLIDNQYAAISNDLFDNFITYLQQFDLLTGGAIKTKKSKPKSSKGKSKKHLKIKKSKKSKNSTKKKVQRKTPKKSLSASRRSQ